MDLIMIYYSKTERDDWKTKNYFPCCMVTFEGAMWNIQGVHTWSYNPCLATCEKNRKSVFFAGKIRWVTPWKIFGWNLKIISLKRISIFQTFILGYSWAPCYISGCNLQMVQVNEFLYEAQQVRSGCYRMMSRVHVFGCWLWDKGTRMFRKLVKGY